MTTRLSHQFPTSSRGRLAVTSLFASALLARILQEGCVM